MTTLQGARLRLADRLFQNGAIQFGEFRLKLHESNPDAPLSPIYLNLRTPGHTNNPGPLDDASMALVQTCMAEMPQLLIPNCFAAIPEAGLPFGRAYGRMAKKLRVEAHPQELRLHKVALADGSRRISDVVDGNYRYGQVCMLIDDLITQAHSKYEAIEALENKGLRVRQILVLVDREQGGSEELAVAGYEVVSIFKLSQLLTHYVERNTIDQATADRVLAYAATVRA